MEPIKKKALQVGTIILFSIGSYTIYLVNRGSSDDSLNEKLNAEASKATLSDRLRANSLKPVELSQAKISDAETQKLENKSKGVTYSPIPINEAEQAKRSENNKSSESKKDSNTKDFSPWNAALSGVQPEQTESIPDISSIPNGQGMVNTDASKVKDAQKFVSIVSTPGLVHDAVVRKVDAPSKNDSSSSFRSNSALPSEYQSKIDVPKSKFARLADMSSEKLSVLVGKEQVAGRGQMFKAGTRVYALLPDKLTVTNGEKLDTSLIAFGSTEQKFPNNVTFVGQAQLNKSNRRVEILIDKCVNTRDDSPPIPCKAIVKDIMGDNGLSGKIYDPANWQLLIATAGTFLSTYVLGTLTTTVAQTGVTVDPTVANQVRQALASSVNSIATRLSDSINRSGTEITISPGAIVQIFFVDTTTTWNLNSD